jgi:hypothetical protein
MKIPNHLCLCHIELNTIDINFLTATYGHSLPIETNILLAIPRHLEVSQFISEPLIWVELYQELPLPKKVTNRQQRALIKPIHSQDAERLTLLFLTHDIPELLLVKVAGVDISSSQESAFATVSLIHSMSECDDSSTEEIEEESSLHKAQELKKLVLNHAQCNSG